MSTELTTVHLVGSLGRDIGRSRWELDVYSVAEALRAINVNTGGALERYLGGPARNRPFRVALQKRTNVIGRDELGNRSGRSTIYIMPAIRGRNSGGAKILVGAALIALTLATGGFGAAAGGWAFAGTTAAGTAGGLTALGTVAIGFGTSFLLGGITQLITPTPKGPSTSTTEQRDSTAFPGNTTAVAQGGCVPLVYGRALVSPVPVCVTTENNDVPTTDAGTEGTVETTDLQGGGQQYGPGTES